MNNIETIKEAAEYYLEHKSLQAAGRYFGCDPQTVSARFEMLRKKDPELYEKVEELRAGQYKKGVRREQRIKEKPVTRVDFNSLGKVITKRALVNWYSNTSFKQSMTVNALINIVEQQGIVVTDKDKY